MSAEAMKQIQEWLGHSDFSTTANIYSHLEYSSKISSADALAKRYAPLNPDKRVFVRLFPIYQIIL